MATWLGNLLASTVFTSAVLGAIAFLCRDWISARLTASIQHQYAQKLESHRAFLQREHDQLRSSVEQAQGLFDTAAATFGSVHQAAFARRLSAIEAAWREMVRIRRLMPPAITFLDLLTDKQIKETSDVQGQLRSLTSTLTMEHLNEVMIRDPEKCVECHQPFCDAELWSTFTAYQVFITRVWVLMLQGHEKGQYELWRHDHGVRAILDTALFSDAERAEFEALVPGGIFWVLGKLESQYVERAQRVLTGAVSAETALDTARITLANLKIREESERAAATAVRQPTS
jgi:hypothetical protein